MTPCRGRRWAASWRTRRWHDARRLEVDVLLWRLDGGPELAAFVGRALGPLLEHDRVRPQPLLPTLAAYLGHGAHRTGRKTEAARALRVNRQTLHDRLSRIAALLDADLDDPESQLRLRLALRALDRIPPGGRGQTAAALRSLRSSCGRAKRMDSFTDSTSWTSAKPRSASHASTPWTSSSGTDAPEVTPTVVTPSSQDSSIWSA
ncbi:hypothetical protein HNR61_000106 [Actinomadura namibiensis]|uniref:PucR C-terminal helix-turn-helix domain-containing protein n=1 Tax=Actinomadura namibiensis TaxID=182080 RepID=A0A7W3QJ25_ACTNM|nr:hypothetical protein [Actinomadura namibiensis]